MRLAVVCDAFPELTETFVANEVRALREAGHDVEVLSLGSPRRPAALGEPLPRIHRLEDVPRARRAAAMAALATRDPRAVLADARDRRAYRPAEDPRRLTTLAPWVTELHARGVEHLHAHFAAGAALEALRLGALLRLPVSITAHAYDIFLAPRNLRAKLERAAFVTTGCAYNVRHLEAVAPGARVHEVVMGVDVDAWTRGSPLPHERHVLAVGRLVEKKGFDDLVRACARARVSRLTLVGEGPLEGALRGRAAELGIADRVVFAGAQPTHEVRRLLEGAAVLAMPCVVGADGDRDSMPVVVKEAMAMEVPVVVTEEVGLPELVTQACGRLVPPRDHRALAQALDEVLDAPPEVRVAWGRAGRERVRATSDLRVETRKLSALIAAAAP